MNFLEERIAKDGVVKPGNVLKVDSFLNHQMDIALMEEIGREFKRRFGHKTVTKVMTIEASGIGIACLVAQHFGVPVVFAKKAKSINIDGDVYVAEVKSFTHKKVNQVILSKSFLSSNDHVLRMGLFVCLGPDADSDQRICGNRSSVGGSRQGHGDRSWLERKGKNCLHHGRSVCLDGVPLCLGHRKFGNSGHFGDNCLFRCRIFYSELELFVG